MRDRALILGGLAVVVAAVTWPVWRPGPRFVLAP